MKKIAAFSLVLLMMAAGCSKSTNNDNTDHGSSTGLQADGFGPSDKPVAGPYWSLPAGVQLEDSIHEYSYCWAYPPYTQVERKDWKGIPTGFTFCLTLSNTTNVVITIQFPPELVFVSSSNTHQNVLTMDIGTVILNPGLVTTIVVQGFCLNETRSIPQAYEAETQEKLSYSFGPSQLPAALKEIADIVHPKHITMNDILKADGSLDVTKSAKYSAIQGAIWEVTDEKGLTNNTRELLKGL